MASCFIYLFILADEDDLDLLEVGRRVQSPFDLLADSIPSAIPSPELEPLMSAQSNPDLISLNSTSPLGR